MKQLLKYSFLTLAVLPLLAGCGNEKKAKKLLEETNVDQAGLQFIKTAMQSGNKEIAAGQLGAKKAQNPRVRAFAGMMVHDHQQSAQELLRLSDKKLVTPDPGILPQGKQTLDSIAKFSGGDFDRAFMSLMIKDHEKAIELHKQGAGNRINAVKDYAQKQLPALQMHLDSARKIYAEIATH